MVTNVTETLKFDQEYIIFYKFFAQEEFTALASTRHVLNVCKCKARHRPVPCGEISAMVFTGCKFYFLKLPSNWE